MNTLQLAFGIVEIILGITVIVLVLVQAKGSDLGGFMGGGGGGDFSGHTRRGVEATMHRVTIGFVTAFFIVTFVTFLLWGA